MKTYLTAATILLASTGAGWSQSASPCDPNDISGTCSTMPDLGSGTNTQGTVGQGTTSTPGSTSSITQPPIPRGMEPLVVPNDPLGTGVNPNSTGGGIGSSTNRGTVGGITTPTIQSPSIR
jgi:hypothetical protein